ncbi:MAG: hypothetical protein JO307_33380 [Bryobacterales bacterium]|nr:hypothetical protein [Bryobacterales bacterium]MBV9396678.1 hypothetical protein [Bryobacterales bacterium]
MLQLWAQHNEHRIPWGKLAEYTDLKLFGGRNISLLLEIYFLRLLEYLFLFWMFHRSGVSRAQMLTVLGFALFCIYYPIQIENFCWGFQTVFVCLPAAACIAIGAAVLHGCSTSTQGSRSWWSWAMAASLCAGIVAETSLASGVFIWPILLIVSIIYRTPLKSKLLILYVGAMAVAAYLWGYVSPSQHSNPFSSLRQPVAVARYVLAYLAFSWDPKLPDSSAWPTFFQLIAICAIAVVAVALVKALLFGPKTGQLQIFLACYATFLLIVAASTALGRVSFGVEQATSSRYQSLALDFWACVGGILVLWRCGSRTSSSRLVEIQTLMFVLLIASVPRFTSAASGAEARQHALEEGWRQVTQSPSTAAGVLYPLPIPEAYAYLRFHHLGPPMQLPLDATGAVTRPEGLRVNGYRILPPADCEGWLDSVKKVSGKEGEITAAGWAWNAKPAKRPNRVLLADARGDVMNTTDVNVPRPDVPKAIPHIRDVNTGWVLTTHAQPGAVVRAFAVSDDSTAVCPLTGTFKLQ